MKIVSRAPVRSNTDDALVPLINIVFLMLIFFLLAGTIGPSQTVPIEPPAADTRTPLREESLELVIDQAGTVHLRGEVVPLEQLAATVQAAFGELRQQAGTRVRLDLLADYRLPAAQLDPVLLALREAEIEDIYLKTRARQP